MTEEEKKLLEEYTKFLMERYTFANYWGGVLHAYEPHVGVLVNSFKVLKEEEDEKR